MMASPPSPVGHPRRVMVKKICTCTRTDADAPLTAASSIVSTRDWSELPLDALASVFGKLGAFEILMGASLVCCSWFAAAKLPDLWRSVDLADALARVAVDRSAGQTEKFVGDFFVTDALLKYIGDRSPALKALSLTSYHRVSNEGFTQLVTKCPLLEDIHLSLSFSQHVGGRDVFESAGMACAHLKRFTLCKAPFVSRWELSGEALGIAAMHELRSLTLSNSDVTNRELKTILDGCPHLELLDLRGCFNIVRTNALRARCAGIKSLMLPSNRAREVQEYYDEKLCSRDVDGDYWDFD